MRARGRVHPRPGGRYTDWALFPHVQRFATVPDLLRDLLTADLYGISQNMRRNNEDALLGASGSCTLKSRIGRCMSFCPD